MKKLMAVLALCSSLSVLGVVNAPTASAQPIDAGPICLGSGTGGDGIIYTDTSDPLGALDSPDSCQRLLAARDSDGELSPVGFLDQCDHLSESATLCWDSTPIEGPGQYEYDTYI